MIGYPYTKLMNSNNQVEQGAGLILCSVEAARSLGRAHATAGCSPWPAPTPTTTGSCPTGSTCTRRPPSAWPAPGPSSWPASGVDDLAHVDLYSCFPSAVQIAAAELGLGLDRPLTVTGGHELRRRTVEQLPDARHRHHGRPPARRPGRGRAVQRQRRLHHQARPRRSTPPPRRRRASATTTCRPQVDAIARSRPAADGYAGPVTVESYTVIHDRDGAPEQALLALLTPDGGRTWGSSTDADTMAELEATECVGRSATLAADGRVELAS